MGDVASKLAQSAPAIFDLCNKLIDLFKSKPEQACPINHDVLKNEEVKKELEEKAQELDHGEKQATFKEEQLKREKDDRYEKRDEKTIGKLREMARTKLGLDSVNNYNIAIAGETGVGKSTLINAFCGLKRNDPNAAFVDEKEATMIIKSYKNPNADRLILWDLPGAGTQKNPADTYFNDKCLYAFDYLIFVYAGRYKETDIDLMKQASAFGVPFVCVRNKTNQDYEARCEIDAFEELPKEEAAKKLIEEFRLYTEDQLRQARINPFPPIFIINTWALSRKGQLSFEEAQLIQFVTSQIYKRRNPKNARSQEFVMLGFQDQGASALVKM